MLKMGQSLLRWLLTAAGHCCADHWQSLLRWPLPVTAALTANRCQSLLCWPLTVTAALTADRWQSSLCWPLTVTAALTADSHCCADRWPLPVTAVLTVAAAAGSAWWLRVTCRWSARRSSSDTSLRASPCGRAACRCTGPSRRPPAGSPGSGTAPDTRTERCQSRTRRRHLEGAPPYRFLWHPTVTPYSYLKINTLPCFFRTLPFL